MQATPPQIVTILVAVVLGVQPGCRTSPKLSGPLPVAAERSESEIAESASRVEAQARYASGLSYDLNREPDKALEQYILALQAEPSNEALAMDVSRRLVLTKQLERALEVIQLATSSPGASAILYAQLGVLYGELDRFEEAVKANRKAIEMAPQSLLSYHNLYTLYIQRGDLQKAVGVLDQAAKQDSDDSAYWLDLAELLANFYRTHPEDRELVIERIRACLVRADELGVDGPRRLKLADGYALAGETQKAVDLLLELLEEYEDSTNRKNAVRQKLLSIYIGSDDTDGAIEQLESLVHDYPTNPQANFLLASYAMEKGDSTRATEYFRTTIQLDPNYEQAYYSLAGLLLDGGDAEGAVAVLETARGLFEQNFILEYYSAVGYGMLEAFESAVEHYTKAEIVGRADRRVSLDHRFYFGFGAQLERMKEYDRAADMFRRCLDMKSDFAPALNYLGYMWADLGIHLEESRDYIQRAVELDPENSAYLDSLAWVLYKLDQPNLALVHIQDAIKFHEDQDPDAVLFDHLGDIHHALGNLDQARDAWQKSLEITDDSKVRDKLYDATGQPATE